MEVIDYFLSEVSFQVMVGQSFWLFVACFDEVQIELDEMFMLFGFWEHLLHVGQGAWVLEIKKSASVVCFFLEEGSYYRKAVLIVVQVGQGIGIF